MKKLTILVDMDDTLEHLLDAWIKCVNEKYGYNATCEDCKCWDVSQAFLGLTFEQVYNAIMYDDFWDTVKPIDGAAEALQRFIADGHEVYVATATPYQSVKAKMEKCLFKYYPFLDWNNLIIISNKKLLKADVLIDDGVHNLEGGDYHKILIDAPYNRNYDAESNGMVRVYDWNDIEREVNKLAEK